MSETKPQEEAPLNVIGRYPAAVAAVNSLRSTNPATIRHMAVGEYDVDFPGPTAVR